MREYMLESMKYWVNEYHIDGFRVDLMGVHDIQTMNDIRLCVISRVLIHEQEQHYVDYYLNPNVLI